MASKIYEYAKSISAITNEDHKDVWIAMVRKERDICMPVIAKGNIYQGILAQW